VERKWGFITSCRNESSIRSCIGPATTNGEDVIEGMTLDETWEVVELVSWGFKES
jgi:hypothetical protein